MEVTARTSTAFLTAIFLITAAAFPAALAYSSCDGSGPAHAPSGALSPSGGINSLSGDGISVSSDGTTIDQGIACVLMLVALILTYIIH